MPSLRRGEADGAGNHSGPEPEFTERQGRYLAFIHFYTKVNGRPPAHADMQRYFGTTPPTVQGMIERLHELGLVDRRPGEPRSIRIAVPVERLPVEW